MIMARKRYFYCYSERFKRALVDNGFRVIHEGINRNTSARYWVFIGSEAFNYYKDCLYQNERDKY